MIKLSFMYLKFFFLISLLGILSSCDGDCDSGECPTDNFVLQFEVVDSSGNNCFSSNPALENFLLASNENYDQDIISIFGDELNVTIRSSVSEYIFQYNENDSIVLVLEGEITNVECCDNRIDVLVDYKLIEQNSQEVICQNCANFEVVIPNCN